MRSETSALSDLSDDAGQTPLLEDVFGYNLKRAYLIVQADFRRALGDQDLGPRVFSALSLFVQFPDITQSGLARMPGIERSGLVALVDDLQARGYVERTEVPGDRRDQAAMVQSGSTA